MERPSRSVALSFLAAVLLNAAAPHGAAQPQLVPTEYCVIQLGGAVTPYTFLVDPADNYLYLTLPTTASKSFVDIWDILATINATGTPTYGAQVANIATIVDTVGRGVVNGTNAGSIITQFKKIHLVRGRCRGRKFDWGRAMGRYEAGALHDAHAKNIKWLCAGR